MSAPVSRVALRTAAALGVLVASAAALAQSGGGYEIRRATVDGGGAAMTGANGIVLQGTVGQPDAGAAMVGAGGYRLAGGFWVAAEPAVRADALFENGFE